MTSSTVDQGKMPPELDLLVLFVNKLLISLPSEESTRLSISLQSELVKVPSVTLKSLTNALLMSSSMLLRVHQTTMPSRRRMRLRLEH
ncbi:hypothetical protein QQ045_033075 [Rhodiola kirilowii]